MPAEMDLRRKVDLVCAEVDLHRKVDLVCTEVDLRRKVDLECAVVDLRRKVDLHGIIVATTSMSEAIVAKPSPLFFIETTPGCLMHSGVFLRYRVSCSKGRNFRYCYCRWVA